VALTNDCTTGAVEDGREHRRGGDVCSNCITVSDKCWRSRGREEGAWGGEEGVSAQTVLPLLITAALTQEGVGGGSMCGGGELARTVLQLLISAALA
jgi:hypothetical protein